MAANKVSVSILSHNINGFSSSESFLRMRCDDDPNSIICVQEHWLRPTYKNMKSINQLRNVHPKFDGYGVSAMKGIHNDAIMTGRPYGGTGFIFNKDFTPFLQPVLQYEGERVSVMKLVDEDYSIFVINAFKQNTDEHRVQYLELLAYIESIIVANPSAKFIILGDLNYNIYDDRQSMSKTIHDFLCTYNLICTHDLDSSFDPNSSYTRCCIKSGAVRHSTFGH